MITLMVMTVTLIASGVASYLFVETIKRESEGKVQPIKVRADRRDRR